MPPAALVRGAALGGRGKPLHPVGRIAEIWRYPVSSLGGEQVESTGVGSAGIDGDRLYSLIDRISGQPAAPEKDPRWRKALHLQANCVGGELPVICFPDGASFALDESCLNGLLSDYFGFATAIASHADGNRCDFPTVPYRHPHFPMHVLTTTSLQHLAGLREVDAVDVRRFRPSVLLDIGAGSGFVENQWVGDRLRLGAVELQAEEATKRCGITLIAQPELDEDPEILRHILRHNKRHLGIYCSVASPGIIHSGDDVVISSSSSAG
jgi:uncharacterized protein YcbX